MAFRSRLLSTTMLSGVVSFTLLNALTARAADLSLLRKAPIPDPPAVDGVNGKIDGFAGSAANKPIYGAQGVLSFPLQRQYGLQIDGSGGSLDGSGFASVAGHLFWRNPRQALVGIYVDYANWNRFGGVQAAHVAGEGAYYFGQFTLEGIAGVEFGNSVSVPLAAGSSAGIVTTPQNGAIPGVITTTTTTSTLIGTYDIKTRFFDQVNLAYYPTDDIKAYVGHRYLGGLHAAAFGGELALPLGNRMMGSAFVEAVAGEHSFHGIWGGLKLYFGQSDKPLKARHRRDDPPAWSGDLPYTLLNNQGSSTTASSSITSQQFCNASSEFPILVGGVCMRAPSDVRLKRDIVPLRRLANGIALYRYRYIGDDTLYVGVMAQEVARIVPDAVVRGVDGFLRVNYTRLGLRMMTWDEWLAAGEQSVTLAAA